MAAFVVESVGSPVLMVGSLGSAPVSPAWLAVPGGPVAPVVLVNTSAHDGASTTPSRPGAPSHELGEARELGRG